MSSGDLDANGLSWEALEQQALFGAQRSSFDFKYVFRAIRANLWLLLAIIGVILAGTLVFTLLQTPRYTASTTVQINNAASNVLGDKGDNQTEDSIGLASDTERYLQTQVDILNSRGLALRVSQQLKLAANPKFFKAQQVDAPTAQSKPVDVERTVIGLLQKNLTVKLPRDSRILTISFESTDPEIAAAVANSYASEFIQWNLRRKFDSTSYARDFISNQLATTKHRLEDSERALNAYSRAAGLVRSSEASTGDGKAAASLSVTGASLVQLNTAANEATSKRIAAESRWRAMSSGPLLSATEIITNPTIANLLAQRSALEVQLEEDRAKHLDDYPSVRAKKQEIIGINAAINSAANNIRNAVRSEYESALRGEQQLAGAVSGLKGQALSEQDRTVQYGLLAREVDTNRQMYDGLLQRFKELNASSGISLSNILLVDNADVPRNPSSPKLWQNLGIAFLAAVALAGVVVFLKDQLDDSVRMPEDVESKLSLPLLTVVPKTRSNRDPELDLQDAKSAISEAYNSLGGALMFSTAGGLPQVLLVTSSQPAEGKSTTSYAIARGLARLGKRTVLIDADLRRPTLHRRIDYDNGTGLTTLLTSQEPVETVLQDSGVGNLSFITSGPVPPSPTELFASGRFEALLQEMASKFDVVVLDSPPVLGLADSPIMSAMADGVVFVVEADRSRHGSLRASLRRLRAMRPVIVGAVLTKFDPLRGANRYSAYYNYDYYQYQYGYRAEDEKA